MEDESVENRGCLIKILLFLAVDAIIVAALWAAGLIRWENTPDESEEIVAIEQEMIVADSVGDFVVSEAEWKALQKEVRQLRIEVNQLKSDKTK